MTEVAVRLKRINEEATTFLGTDCDGQLTEVNNQVHAKVFPNFSVGFKAWAEYFHKLERDGVENIPYIIDFLPAHLLYKRTKGNKENSYA